MGILLHCGAEAISRTELALVPTPEGRGRFHRPYSYSDFVDHVSDAISLVGLEIQDEKYGVTKNGARFFGLMALRSRFDRDFGLLVGLRGSHDQSIPRGLAAGANVFVCDNLSFMGEASFNTKQTTHIADRLPGLVMQAVETLPGMYEVQDARFDQYKQTELKPRWGDAALVELVRREAINPSQLGRAISYWDKPETEAQQEEPRNLWRLHNAVTAALKAPTDDDGVPSRPNVLGNWQKTIVMTGFLDKIADFEPAKVAA